MSEPETAGAIIQVRDLWFRYADQPPVLRGIHLDIAPGEWLAILGCNGSGKTTLVKHFNGLLRPWRGQVLVAGQDTAGHPIGELAQIVGYLPQHPDRLLFAPTVREEIAFGLRQRGLEGPALQARIDASLQLLDLRHIADMPPAVLGYGLRRKVSLAAILASRPRVLALDEPTIGLDAGSARAFFDCVREFHRAGATVIMITHELELAARYAEHVILLREGEIIARGETREVLSDADQLKRAGLMPLPISQLYALWVNQTGENWASRPLTPEEFAAAWLASSARGGVP